MQYAQRAIESSNQGSITKSDNSSQPRSDNKVYGLCKFGNRCYNKKSCPFQHKIIRKPCKYGSSCRKQKLCLFLHDEATDSDDPASERNVRKERQQKKKMNRDNSRPSGYSESKSEAEFVQSRNQKRNLRNNRKDSYQKQGVSGRNKQSLASANERERDCWYNDESEGSGINEYQGRIYDDDMTDKKHNRYAGNSWQKESKRREFVCESNDSFSD